MAGKKTSSGVFVSWPRPDFKFVVKTNKYFKSNYNAALMYAHYELSAVELKREVVKYLKSLDAKHPMLDRIKDMHENRFITIGKYMYILNHGSDLPDNIFEGMMPHLEKTIAEEEAKIEREALEAAREAQKNNLDQELPAIPKVVITIQDRIREKAREAAGEVEGWIDDLHLDRKLPVKTVEEFVNLFKSYDLKGPHVRVINTSFGRRANEIIEAIDSKDKDLNEGYSHYTKVDLKKVSQLYTNLLKACEMFQDAAKVERAPKKKKPVSQEKVAAKLKFKKDDPSLGIVSLNPVQIIGSKEVWTYNTKSRKLTQFKAADERGLMIKGASLENISSKSMEKTLRKPAETLAEFKKASKVKLRTFLDELTTVDTYPNGRFSEFHVILRIDK